MSIIHDALKKVQQGLKPQTDDTQVNQPVTKQNPSPYIYEENPSVVAESSPQATPQASNQKPPIRNKIKSILAMACAVLITIAAGLYVWQQFRTNIPKVRTFARRSFDKLIHKNVVPDFKNKTPEELKAMGQFTVNPSTAKTPNSVKSAPITLDIHGIMANPTGNLVLIDDQVYQEGDMVEGAKIIKIDLDSIKVLNNGIEQTVFVKD